MSLNSYKMKFNIANSTDFTIFVKNFFSFILCKSQKINIGHVKEVRRNFEINHDIMAMIMGSPGKSGVDSRPTCWLPKADPKWDLRPE